MTPAPTDTTVPARSRPGTRRLGVRRPVEEPGHARQAGHEVPRAAVEAGGPHVHEHLPGARRGHVEGARPQDVGRPVRVLDDGAHRRGPVVAGLLLLVGRLHDPLPVMYLTKYGCTK